MTQRYFCTLFDNKYLVKGLVMLRTITQHSPGARVFVLCIDELTRELMTRLAIPGVQTLPLAEVETEDVLAAKKTRSMAEYCWTLSSVLAWHVMNKHADAEIVTYLDADLMFFSPVEPLFEEMGRSSIAAIEHRYTPRLAHLEVYGRFNVQWVSFRRDSQGLSCLKSWRDQCIEWCFAVAADGKLGDQKYLDAWPGQYSGFHSIQHIGAGVAPWNYANYRTGMVRDQLRVDSVPLIFYHFHQFQILEGGRYDYCSSNYAQDAAPPELVYGRYREAIEAALADVRRIDPAFKYGIRTAGAVTLRRLAQRYLPLRLKNALHRVGVRAW